jgi:hypothetical protein
MNIHHQNLKYIPRLLVSWAHWHLGSSKPYLWLQVAYMQQGKFDERQNWAYNLQIVSDSRKFLGIMILRCFLIFLQGKGVVQFFFLCIDICEHNASFVRKHIHAQRIKMSITRQAFL